MDRLGLASDELPRIDGFYPSFQHNVAKLGKDLYLRLTKTKWGVMKILLSLALFAASATAFGSAGWIVLTRAQHRLVTNDKCAAAALDAATGLVSEEIQESGVDFPDHLYLSDLYVSKKGKLYVITFRDDSSILVETQKTRTACSGEASRIRPE